MKSQWPASGATENDATSVPMLISLGLRCHSVLSVLDTQLGIWFWPL